MNRQCFTTTRSWYAEFSEILQLLLIVKGETFEITRIPPLAFRPDNNSSKKGDRMREICNREDERLNIVYQYNGLFLSFLFSLNLVLHSIFIYATSTQYYCDTQVKRDWKRQWMRCTVKRTRDSRRWRRKINMKEKKNERKYSLQWP